MKQQDGKKSLDFNEVNLDFQKGKLFLMLAFILVTSAKPDKLALLVWWLPRAQETGDKMRPPSYHPPPYNTETSKNCNYSEGMKK